jgi:hypothetical protein
VEGFLSLFGMPRKSPKGEAEPVVVVVVCRPFERLRPT